MLVRTLGGLLLLAILPASSFAQATPLLSKVPTVTDTQISGTAQGLSPQYDAILLYVCTSATATPPLDCSAEDTTHGRKRTLVNLGVAPFAVNTPDGKFTITIASSLVPGAYVWITQKMRSHTDQSETSRTSTPVRVPVPLLRKASISVSGFDSASKDVGAKLTLDFDHGLQNEGWGETQFITSGTYDDKWKKTAFSSKKLRQPMVCLHRRLATREARMLHTSKMRTSGPEQPPDCPALDHYLLQHFPCRGLADNVRFSSTVAKATTRGEFVNGALAANVVRQPWRVIATENILPPAATIPVGILLPWRHDAQPNRDSRVYTCVLGKAVPHRSAG